MSKDNSFEKFFDDALKAIQDGMNKLVEKTDQLTQIGRIKLDILSIKREIDKRFSELGGHIYQLVAVEQNKHALDDAQSRQFIEQIKVLEARLADKKAELERVSKAEAKAKTGGAETSTQQPATSDTAS